MILRDEAVVLRVAPHANTSCIVTWLTREHGRVVTLVKGARRPKSLFLGQFDFFYTCELLYYDRGGDRIDIARECCPLKLRPALRADWRSAALASYLADLAQRAFPADNRDPFAFQWLDAALDQLAAGTDPGPFLVRFELALLDHLGLAPSLRRCAACNAPMDETRRKAVFSLKRGGAVCAACSAAHSEAGYPLTPDVMAILQAWQPSSRNNAADRLRTTPQQRDEALKLTGQFLQYHVDLPPDVRIRALALALAPRQPYPANQ